MHLSYTVIYIMHVGSYSFSAGVVGFLDRSLDCFLCSWLTPQLQFYEFSMASRINFYSYIAISLIRISDIANYNWNNLQLAISLCQISDITIYK